MCYFLLTILEAAVAQPIQSGAIPGQGPDLIQLQGSRGWTPADRNGHPRSAARARGGQARSSR
jgi:hypothetical protein